MHTHTYMYTVHMYCIYMYMYMHKSLNNLENRFSSVHVLYTCSTLLPTVLLAKGVL